MVLMGFIQQNTKPDAPNFIILDKYMTIIVKLDETCGANPTHSYMEHTCSKIVNPLKY